MKGPEDDAGLAGKVAIVSGGGAAGDGIGNGRAAAILLARAGTRVLVGDREAALAGRTVAMIAGDAGTGGRRAPGRGSPRTAARGRPMRPPSRTSPKPRRWSPRRSTASAGSTS